MEIVRSAIMEPRAALEEVAIEVDRLRLAKRRWRGVAADGTEFGFELETPLAHGAVVWESGGKQYRLLQLPEPLLEVSLQVAPSAAAGIGWAIGNLHLELSAEASRLLTPDDPATRQLLERLRIPFATVNDIFRPGRFARGSDPSAPARELGRSHRH